MKLPLLIIAIGILLFVATGPGEHEVHTFAWILGVADAALVAWSMTGGG